MKNKNAIFCEQVSFNLPTREIHKMFMFFSHFFDTKQKNCDILLCRNYYQKELFDYEKEQCCYF